MLVYLYMVRQSMHMCGDICTVLHSSIPWWRCDTDSRVLSRGKEKWKGLFGGISADGVQYSSVYVVD